MAKDFYISGEEVAKRMVKLKREFVASVNQINRHHQDILDDKQKEINMLEVQIEDLEREIKKLREAGGS